MTTTWADRTEKIRRRRQQPEPGRRWTDSDVDALLEESEALATALFELKDQLASLGR